MPLPGGITAALAVLNDPVPADRAQFLVEVIRRTYATPISARADPRAAALRALLEHLDRERARGMSSAVTLPLPLTPPIWMDAVFGGRATPDTLAAAILESRNASLLYFGLLSVDGPTRAWIGSQHNLVSELATRYAPAFAVAAPGFRVSDGRVRVPGGEAAEPAWEALVGRRVTEPAEFLRALLTTDDARLGYLLAALSEAGPDRIAFALGPDPANRSAALRRIATVFGRVTAGWRVNERTLWRPRRDPALLLSDLAMDERGRPALPGSRAFWTAAFSPGALAPPRGRGAEFAGDADFSWLCDQVFSGALLEQRRRYDAVLFASRVVKHITPETAEDAAEAVHSVFAQPALAAVLERASADAVAVYAAAARRAARLSAISHEEQRIRSLTQFQGTLALLGRMVSRGSITPHGFGRAVSSLSELDWNTEGDYEGAVVRWFAQWIQALKPDTPLDEALMQLLAGTAPASPRYVDWEGTRYRVDLAAAERARLARLLGDEPHVYLSAAAAMLQIDSTKRRRLAADDAWARAVTELSYAIAIGEPEHGAVTIADIARRHDFEVHVETGRAPGSWMLPAADGSARGFHIGGALLGLEAALGEFSLTRVSTKAPPRKPTLSSEERAAFIETVPLVEPARLLDEDQDRIVSALRAARERVAAIRTAEEAERLAQSIPLGSIRRSLLPWVAVYDPARIASFLSPVELLWLGLGNAPIAGSMNGWGVSAYARIGCLCLQVIDRRSGDTLGGRVNAGMLASGFPDLEIRLAELLADLKMPAALLGGVLASATFDFVNGVSSRDEDDRRGLVEFVLALRVDRVEEYLALLTTGGPLVPPRDNADRLEGVAPAGRRP